MKFRATLTVEYEIKPEWEQHYTNPGDAAKMAAEDAESFRRVPEDLLSLDIWSEDGHSIIVEPI